MTLYRETPCQHGQQRAHMYGEESGKEFSVGENMLRCTEFSCEEVSVDYAIAFQTWWRHDHILNDQERLVIAIDAALHTEKETASTV